MIKHYRTAQLLSQELLAQAQENEPNITADLQTIADKVSAEMVGLANKFKTEESLIQKLVQITKNDSAEFSQILDKINDALRYTFVLSFELYNTNFQQTMEELRKIGYQLPEDKIWNAWINIGTRFDRGYRGINTTIISSKNQKFELQFHTAESFDFKTRNHHLYKESKKPETSSERKREIARNLVKMAGKIKMPKGVK